MALAQRRIGGLKELVEKYNIHFESSGDASKWPAQYQHLFRSVQDLGNVKYTDYSSNSDSHVPKTAQRNEIIHRVSVIVNGARKCRQDNAKEAAWRAALEREIFQRFAQHVICEECNSEQLHWDESKQCPCLSMDHNLDVSDDHTKQMFNQCVDMAFTIDSSLEKGLHFRFRPDLTIALRGTDVFKNLQVKHEGAFSRAETIRQRIQTSPFKSATTDAVFPFLILESKAEVSLRSFSKTELLTALPIRTLLKLQHDLNLVSSTSLRTSDVPLVWCLFSRGSEWRLAGACIEERQGVQEYHVFYLWMGHILRRDDALQLVLIVDYIADWARNVYRPDICSKLALSLEEPEEITFNLGHQGSEQLPEEETTFNVTEVQELTSETTETVSSLAEPNDSSQNLRLLQLGASGIRMPNDEDSRDEDLVSLASNNDDIGSQLDTKTSYPHLLGENHLASVLGENQELSLLFKEILHRTNSGRFIDNIRRILKDYFLDLHELANSISERREVELLRRHSGRTRIARAIAEIARPSAVKEKLDLLGIKQQPSFRDWILNDWIREVEIHNTDQESLFNKDIDIEHFEVDHTEPLIVDEPEPENETDIPLGELKRIEEFFTAGDPFHRLLVKVKVFSMPGSLLSLTRILMTIPTPHIWFSERYEASFMDRIKLSLERLTDCPWDWSLLARPKPSLPQGCVRINWRCHCGQDLWTDVTTSQAEKYRSLLLLRGNQLESEHLCLGMTISKAPQSDSIKQIFKCMIPIRQEPATSNRGVSTSPSLAVQSSTQAQGIPVGRNPLSNHSSISNNAGTHNAPRPGMQQSGSTNINVGSPSPAYVLLGVSGARPTLDIAHLNTGQAVNDGDFFNTLKQEYKRCRGMLRVIFSIWKLSHCNFVKFEKFQENMVICRGPDVPISMDYEYEPRPPIAETPLISTHEFRVRLTACTYPCPMALFHKCRLPSTGKSAIQRIPKRKGEWEIKSAQSGLEYAWGLEPSFCVCDFRLYLYHLLILFGPFVFWFWWQGAHPQDMQTASIPASFAVGFLSLFWTLNGALESLQKRA